VLTKRTNAYLTKQSRTDVFKNMGDTIKMDFNQTGCEYVDWIFAVADRVQWEIHVKMKVKYEFLVTRKIPLLAYWLHASQIQLRGSWWLQ